MKTIEPLQLEALIDRGKSVELIDVRPQIEFDKIHALGARSIPLAELRPTSLLNTRKLPDGEPLYIICRSGVLAKLAAEELATAGFDNSIVVEGGMKAWEHKGLPVVRMRSTGTAWTLALLAVLIVAMALASWVRDYLVVLPLLIAVGVITLDLIEGRRSTTGPRRQAVRGRITLARAGGQ